MKNEKDEGDDEGEKRKKNEAMMICVQTQCTNTEKKSHWNCSGSLSVCVGWIDRCSAVHQVTIRPSLLLWLLLLLLMLIITVTIIVITIIVIHLISLELFIMDQPKQEERGRRERGTALGE